MSDLPSKYLALLNEADRRGDADVAGLRACFALLSLTKAIDADCAVRLASHGLSEGRFVLLCLLRGEPAGLSPHELADRAEVTRATITGLLDGLERSRLIERRAHEGDRRRISVRLTAAGRDRAETLFTEHTRWIASLFAGFSDADRDALSRLLGRVGANLDAGKRERAEREHLP